MTGKEVHTAFQALYQERSGRHFDGSWAVEVINDSIDDLDAEIADLHPEFAGFLSTTLSYGVDVQERPLPSGLIEIAAVEVTDRGGPPYPRLLPAEFNDRSAAIVPNVTASWLGLGGKGEPTHYYVRGADPASAASQMGFIPIPQRVGSNNITVWYHGTRVRITTDTYQGAQLDLPHEWHALVPVRMCILAATTDNNPNLNVYVGMYNSRLEKRLAAALRGRSEAQVEMIEIVDDW